MNYIPDSVYTLCGEFTQDCNICQNNVYSTVLGGYVHDSQRGKVFCPFGKLNTMNIPTFGDQIVSNIQNNKLIPNWSTSTWGHAPQMDPRPLSKIGLSWRTS